MLRRSTIAGVIAVGSLAGCAVGPNFRAPAAPSTANYTRGQQPDVTTDAPVSGGEAQTFIADRDIPADWYGLFQSEQLDGLVRRALHDSPTVEAAKAALRSAENTYIAERGALFLPQADGQLGVTRERVPGAAFGDPAAPTSLFTLYNASVNVSYRLDIFGASRRQLEQLRAQTDFQRWELEAASLTLTGNEVTTAFDVASLTDQLAAVEDVVSAETEQYKVVQRQFEVWRRFQGRRPVATGAARPGTGSGARTGEGTRASPTQARGVGRAHARRCKHSGLCTGSLHAADAVAGHGAGETGPAAAGRAGGGGPVTSSHCRGGSRDGEPVPAIESDRLDRHGIRHLRRIVRRGYGHLECRRCAASAFVSWLFHGGELRYKRRAAVADLEHADATYRQTVLAAMEEVADTLRALETDARALQAQVEAEKAAADAFEISKKQFRVGGVSYVTVLNTQRLFLEARQSRVQAQAARYSDSAALFQALGGGWWNRKDQEVASK